MGDLNEVLIDLRKYGTVVIHSYEDNTWSCKCNISGTSGAITGVTSELIHLTPMEASHQCQERVADYLSTLA